MSITWEDITDAFSLFGTTFDDTVTAGKCIALCRRFSWEAADFADQWIAFSKGNGTVVSDDKIDLLMRELEKNSKSAAPIGSPIVENRTPRAQKRIAVQSPITTPRRDKSDSCKLSLAASFTDGSDSTPAKVYKSGRRTGQIVTSHIGKQTSSLSSRKNEETKQLQISVVNDLAIGAGFQNFNRTKVNMALLERLARFKGFFRHKNEAGEDVVCVDIAGGAVERDDYVFGLLRPPVKPNLPYQLYGDYETSRSSSMSVLPKFPAFPGQIVVAKVGNSVTANASVANVPHFIESPVSPTMPPSPEEVELTTGINIMAAAGPFTTSDTLSYQPYYDFVSKLASNEPDIAFIFGPFVDRSHKKLSSKLQCGFESYFYSFLEYLNKEMTGKKTRLFIVANHRENHITSRAFPTEKYEVSGSAFPKMTFLNDPSILNINGLQIGVSFTDILRTISDSLCNVQDENVDRIDLSLQYILEQRSFYPVWPPSGDLIVRAPLVNEFLLEKRPHMLILPATVQPFVTSKSDCLFVNPGTVAKGMDSGSYATIEITPFKGTSVTDHCTVDVVKV